MTAPQAIARTTSIPAPRRPMPLWMMLFTSALLIALPAFATFIAHLGTPDSSRLRLYVSVPGDCLGTDVMTVSSTHYQPGSFVPVVRYHYTVNGTDYTGSRVQVSGPNFQLLGQAQDYAKQWAAAGRVTVWYDPANPASSVLATTPGPRGAAWAMGGLFGTIAALFLAISWTTWLRDRRAERRDAQRLAA